MEQCNEKKNKDWVRNSLQELRTFFYVLIEKVNKKVYGRDVLIWRES